MNPPAGFIPLLLCSYWALVYTVSLTDDIALLQPIPFLCDTLADPQLLTSSGCMQGCRMEKLIGEPVNITIVDPREEVRVIMATCKKIAISQKFTRTWLFSDIASSVQEDHLDPTWQECWDTWETSCKLGECITIRPEITPAYSYASTVTVRKVGIVLESHPTSVKVNIQQTMKLFIRGKFVDFNSGRYYEELSKSWTLWQRDGGDKCHVHDEAYTQCIFSADNIIICDSLGITINYTASRTVSICGVSQALWITDTGIIFRFGSSNSPFAMPKFPVLYLNSDDKTETIIKAVQYSFAATKAEMCARSCLGNYQNVSGLEYFGGNILSNSTGHLKGCRVMRNCKIQRPLTLCLNHNHIRVVCGISTYWWNMVSLEINPEDMCHSPKLVSGAILIKVGEGVYKVNETGIFYHKTSAINRVFDFVPAKHIEVITPSEATSAVKRAKSGYKEWNLLKEDSKTSHKNYLIELSQAISSSVSDFFSFFSGIKTWIVSIVIILISIPLISLLLGASGRGTKYNKVKFVV